MMPSLPRSRGGAQSAERARNDHYRPDSLPSSPATVMARVCQARKLPDTPTSGTDDRYRTQRAALPKMRRSRNGANIVRSRTIDVTEDVRECWLGNLATLASANGRD